MPPKTAPKTAPKAAPKTAPKTAPKAKSKPKSKPTKKGGPREKLKSKYKRKERKKPSSKDKKEGKKAEKSAPKSKAAPSKASDSKVKSTASSKEDKPSTVPACPSNKTEFPMESCPNPEELKPTDITRLYKIPNNQYKTEGDVIAQNGYMLEEKLDEGGFGVIFFARNKKTNTRVACKMMDLGSDWDDDRVADMKNELFIMEKVKHLYVVQLHIHFITQSKAGNRIFIFMQLADGGNCAKFCQKKGAMAEDECKLYLAQMLCGINYMHSLGIAHRDIKLQNILLVSDKNSITGDYTLLVADFGLSRCLRHDRGGNVALNRTICGTPVFMSPELLLKKPYNAFQVDMWAIGVALFIMLSLELPFDFRDEDAVVKEMVVRNWHWPEEKMKAKPSEELNGLMKKLLEPEPMTRITMADMLAHPWVANGYQKAQALANKNNKK